MKNQLAIALPVALLLCMVGVHTWLVRTQALSPWLGAGFGMFSTYDGPGNRFIRVYAEDDGLEWPVDIQPGPMAPAYRYAALPGGDRLSQLVLHLVRENQPDLDGADHLRLEVWRRIMNGRPIIVSAEMIASYRAELSSNDR